VKARRTLGAAAAALLALASVALAGGLGAGAAADTVICDQFGTTTIQNGQIIVQNNRWGASTQQCITVTATGFNVSASAANNATNGAPAGYPSTVWGCHFGNCTPNFNPIQASTAAFGAVNTSVSMSYPGSGQWDAAYDIWFDPTARRNGQNTGAEIMVWLNHMGAPQPVGSRIATVSLAGGTWDVWEGNIGWNVVSYVRTSATGSINFPVSTFFNDAVSRGFAQRAWFLTSIQAGFEPWTGGAGLAVNSFGVTTNGGGGGGGGGAASCTATYSNQSVWQGGFVANIVVRNTGTAPTTGWTVGFTLPSGASVANSWNATFSATSGAISARNMSSNGALAASTDTSFGFQGNGPAPTALTPTCTAS
jgi:hypothetical protein